MFCVCVLFGFLFFFIFYVVWLLLGGFRVFPFSSWFSQVGLFWGILCGQVQEQVYHHQVDSLLTLHAALRAADLPNKVRLLILFSTPLLPSLGVGTL